MVLMWTRIQKTKTQMMTKMVVVVAAAAAEVGRWCWMRRRC